MRKYLLVAAMFAASPAMADLVAATDKGDELRLLPTHCENAAILEQIKPEWRSKFGRASAYVNGRRHAGCWVDTGEGVYYLLWESGEASVFPITIFLEQPGI